MINKKFKKSKYIIGIDEVGRGPLAGPVTVAAVLLPQKLQITNYPPDFAWTKSRRAGKLQTNSKLENLKLKLKDSKKLTPLQREKWFDWVKENKIPYALASISPKIIDKINISNAANLAAAKAFNKLIKSYKLKAKSCKVYLDGGLYLKTKNLKLKAKTVIRGDEKIKAIMLASIVAKVTRDRKMKQLHKKYPCYGFAQHKGYGTKKHFRAIKKSGVSAIHRRTFLKNLQRRRKKNPVRKSEAF